MDSCILGRLKNWSFLPTQGRERHKSSWENNTATPWGAYECCKSPAKQAQCPIQLPSPEGSTVSDSLCFLPLLISTTSTNTGTFPDCCRTANPAITWTNCFGLSTKAKHTHIPGDLTVHARAYIDMSKTAHCIVALNQGHWPRRDD